LNRLRKQKLDIALYDAQYKAHIIKGVVLSATDKLTPVKVDYHGPVKAILINHGDYGYAKVYFDKKSLKNLSQDMDKIDDELSRS